ncbi:hypothetical protein GCM10009775_31270 [Microbacterium aoyamense]|uniref:Septum formation-related domain-containing protein n=1 Tax=Microbacterium aoyamense TaxID=344166 RepID=A0ABN2PWS5_9MICO|nr:hypothetical protein [Microbacterium aoyamense]
MATSIAIAVVATALCGCSVDTLIWGAEGAAVIDTTERLIDAAEAGDGGSLVCEDADPDLRDPADWSGLSAEEPEQFVADYWPDQAPLDPAWSINLSLPASRVASGVEFPGDVFYRESEEGLCLVAVAWSTVE